MLAVLTALRSQRNVQQEVSNVYVNRHCEMLLSSEPPLTTDSMGAGSQALCTSIERICVARQRE